MKTETKKFLMTKTVDWVRMFDLRMESKTTFWDDFRIAEVFGISAIQDTFNRAFNEWKNDIEYITELCIVMNCKAWFYNDYMSDKFNENFDNIVSLYSDYYYKVKDYVYDNMSKEDREYFYRMTD